jgi:hypothetical protein
MRRIKPKKFSSGPSAMEVQGCSVVNSSSYKMKEDYEILNYLFGRLDYRKL